MSGSRGPDMAPSKQKIVAIFYSGMRHVVSDFSAATCEPTALAAGLTASPGLAASAVGSHIGHAMSGSLGSPWTCSTWLIATKSLL